MCGEQSLFAQVGGNSNNVLDCFGQYLAQVNSAQTRQQILQMTKSITFWNLIVEECLNCLLPATFKHLIQKKPFIIAYYLATEALNTHNSMFTEHTSTLAKTLLCNFEALCEAPYDVPNRIIEEFCALLQEYIMSYDKCLLHLAKGRVFEAVNTLQEVKFEEVVCKNPHHQAFLSINQSSKEKGLNNLAKMLLPPDFEAFQSLVNMYEAYSHEQHTLYYSPHEKCFISYFL